MSQLAVSEGQPGNWEEPDFFLRMLETVRFQENGRQEPCESRGSRTDLWERGGEIPLRHPTHRSTKNCDRKTSKISSSIILCTLKEDYDSRNLLKLFKPYLLKQQFYIRRLP
jgi:hypothetical protein